MKIKELVRKITNKIKTGAIYIAFASSLLSVVMPSSAYAIKRDGFEVKDFNFSKSMAVNNTCPGVYVEHLHYANERCHNPFNYLKTGMYNSARDKETLGTGAVSFRWARNGRNHFALLDCSQNSGGMISTIIWMGFTDNPTKAGTTEHVHNYNYTSAGLYCRIGGKNSSTHFVGNCDGSGTFNYEFGAYRENGSLIGNGYWTDPIIDSWIYKSSNNSFTVNHNNSKWRCSADLYWEHNWVSWSSNTADATVVCSKCGKSSNGAYGTRSESYCRNNNNAEVKIGGTANYGVTMTLNYRDLSNNAVSKVLSGGSDQVIAVYPGSNPSITLSFANCAPSCKK